MLGYTATVAALLIFCHLSTSVTTDARNPSQFARKRDDATSWIDELADSKIVRVYTQNFSVIAATCVHFLTFAKTNFAEGCFRNDARSGSVR